MKNKLQLTPLYDVLNYKKLEIMEELFYSIFEDMPRLGPGSKSATLKALSMVDLPERKASVLDIGCGTGVQSLVLAENINGEISVLDNYQPFLDVIKEKASKTKLNAQIECLCRDMNELDFDSSSLDLIWAEGSIYIIGFEKGLEKVFPLLKSGGYAVFSDMNYRKANPPKEVVDLFLEECPNMMAVKQNIQMIHQSDYELVDYFLLEQNAHWEPYYKPLEKRLVVFRGKYEGEEKAMELIESIQHEIDLYKKYSDYYGYTFYIMRKA